ncbi:hypothetical protein FNV43_RR07024 [Rhamnella rubrinervis]|uniref:Uncharacterized protein n=1 Tax=Rhamnella rubrinervis TaxID=2594499 RepID=A0A8K0MMJ4_9ROSA|nr:hypothetical protein FNV43_RR07024 [Rhamnella rubrinervis]
MDGEEEYWVKVDRTDEEWLKAAMTDDAVVVDLLLHLSKAAPPPSKLSSSAFQLAWSVRQRRSKHVMRHHQDEVDVRKGEAARASPTTPLTWSGATSASGGALDGFEESSKPARSKIGVRRETSSSKRPRKKKTLAQLKEEVNELTNERIDLRQELDTLRLTFEKERATNERLKRLKSQQTMKTVPTAAVSGEAVSHQFEQMDAVCRPTTTTTTTTTSVLPTLVDCDNSDESCKVVVQEAEKKGSAFTLPDLNLPLEE